MLNAQRKWTEEKKDLTVGEVVLCLEPGFPRGKWPLGRIEQIHLGPDGHVQVAHVRIGGMGMFHQLPSYVHWNLTQMQRTNIDADLLWRGILIEF